MAIDQGTTGTTVVLIDHDGRCVAKGDRDFPQIYPQPGWVEHNAEMIWESVEAAATSALEQSKTDPKQIRAIGMTNQRETVLAWRKSSGRPYHNAIVWQCRRTADLCTKLRKRNLESKIREKTGLVLDPYFSASKMNWLINNVPELKKDASSGEALFGTMECYLLWRLTGGEAHKTDVSNASRTMLMNIGTGEWDSDLLKIFQVPRVTLPQITDCVGNFGVTKGLGFLPDGIPITGMAGDQQSALFGQACFSAGDAKCTFGTGSFLLMNTGTQMKVSKSKLITTVAWRMPGQKMVYAIEGSVFICGAAVQWLQEGLQIVKTPAEVETLAAQVQSSDGVFFVPALTGLGAPYWWPDARGAIVGLTRGSSRAHIARATLEGIAFQNVEVLKAMEADLGKKLRVLKVDGGATSNNLLMQIQSDLLGVEVQRPINTETTSLGAAFLAGLGIGFWKSTDDLKQTWKIDRSFAAGMTSKARLDALTLWKQAVQRVK